MTNISMLLYGGPGVGKTALAVSAFWDWKRKKQIRDGRLLLFGCESNPALEVPEKLIKRFVSPESNPVKFSEDFMLYMRAAVREAAKNKGPEVFVFDGFSEWDVLWSLDTELRNKGALGFYGRKKDEFIAFVQLRNPEVLGAHVIGTARVTERKKGIRGRDGSYLVEPDPEYLEFKYIPAMQGWAKENLPHYFSYVFYMETDIGPVKLPSGKIIPKAPVHKVYTLPTGDFWVKNIKEHLWVPAGLADNLTNPSFDDILSILENLSRVEQPAGVEQAQVTKTKEA